MKKFSLQKILISVCTCYLFLTLSSSTAQVVSTFAGSGTSGFTNGTGTAAKLNSPVALTVGASGNLFVVESGNNAVRKITASAVVTILAGSGTWGSTNGSGLAASFHYPYGIAADASGNLYVGDSFNNKIRKITPAGAVTNFAGSGTAGATNGSSLTAKFDGPQGTAVDAAGNVYVADGNNHLIRKITPTGVVTTVAGSGVAGSADGVGTAASFSYPSAVALDAAGNIYVADFNNNKIRHITTAGIVTTLAGTGGYTSVDGPGSIATFNLPSGICVDAAGNVYVADMGNHKIRKITPGGMVSTFAGTGLIGSTDGAANVATFSSPSGVCLDASGTALYVAEASGHKMRKITGIATNINATNNTGNPNIIAYPNPCDNFVTVSFPTETPVMQVTLLNALGETIISAIVSKNLSSLQLDLSELAAGIYMVKANEGKTIKLVKN
jgi:sugar lactone lactonase YvrE